MLVKLILFLLPLLRLIRLSDTTQAVYGDNHIITTGVWTEAETGCGYYTSTLNSSVSLTFKGVSVHVLGGLSPYGGLVQITLDGQRGRLIDLYGAASCGQVLFSSTGLTNGRHSINLELVGESGPNATSTTDGPARLFVFTNFIWSLAPNSSSSLSLSPSTRIISKRWAPRKRQDDPPTTQAPDPTTQAPAPTTQAPPAPPPTTQAPPFPPTTEPPTTLPPTTQAPPSPTPTEPPTMLPPSTTSPTAPTSIFTTSITTSTFTTASAIASTNTDPISLTPTPPTTTDPTTDPTTTPTSVIRDPAATPTTTPTSINTEDPPSPTTPLRITLPISPTTLDPSQGTGTLPPTSSKRRHATPPTTTTLPPVQTVQAVATGPTQDLTKVRDLWSCKPYGHKDCAFNPQASVETNTHTLIVGTPTPNCEKKSNLMVVVGGQLSITDTWSQDATAPGLSLGGAAGDLILNTSETQVWKNSQSYYLAQVVNMTIPPLNQGALVAEVTYKSTNGTLQIGNEQPFSVIANQPQNEVEYRANIIPCEAKFDGNFTPVFYFSAATQSMKPYSRGIVVIVVALAVRILL